MSTNESKPAITKVVVVVKRTYLEDCKRANDTEALKKIMDGHPSMHKVIRADREHHETLDIIRKDLNARSIECEFSNREPGCPFNTDCDLVITAGGDGTAIDASHFLIENAPNILAVNSSLSSSKGHYCIANGTNFRSIMDEILSGQRQPLSVMRLAIYKDGVLLPTPVLNEVTIGTVVGGMAKWHIYIGNQDREREGDGLVISAPGGFTGTHRCYKGKVLPILSKQMGFVTQGPHITKRTDLEMYQGFVAEGTSVRILSQTQRKGEFVIDGSFLKHDFPRGCEIVIKEHSHPLIAYFDPDCNEKEGELPELPTEWVSYH